MTWLMITKDNDLEYSHLLWVEISVFIINDESIKAGGSNLSYIEIELKVNK